MSVHWIFDQFWPRNCYLFSGCIGEDIFHS